MHRTVGLCTILILAACRGSRSGSETPLDTTRFTSLAPSAPLDSTLRVVVTDEPQVYANGKVVTLPALDSMLAALKLIEGEVWFFQQRSDIHLAAQQNSLIDSVLAAVQRHQLALRSSHMADFGDLVGKPRRSPDAETP